MLFDLNLLEGQLVCHSLGVELREKIVNTGFQGFYLQRVGRFFGGFNDVDIYRFMQISHDTFPKFDTDH